VKARTLCSLLCISVLAALAQAQEIRTMNLDIPSENKVYYASIIVNNRNSTEVRVFKDGMQYPLWSNWIDWTIRSYGYITDDGAFFIVLNNDYSDMHNLVMVYSNQKQAAYSVRSIKIQREYLHQASGDLQWFNPEDFMRILYDAEGKAQSIELKVNDGRIMVIDLK